MSDLKHIVDETITALEDLKRAGVTHVPVTPATLAELGAPVRMREVMVAPPPASPPAGWADLEARTRACKKCGERLRYTSSRACVPCAIAKATAYQNEVRSALALNSKKDDGK